MAEKFKDQRMLENDPSKSNNPLNLPIKGELSAYENTFFVNTIEKIYSVLYDLSLELKRNVKYAIADISSVQKSFSYDNDVLSFKDYFSQADVWIFIFPARYTLNIYGAPHIAVAALDNSEKSNRVGRKHETVLQKKFHDRIKQEFPKLFNIGNYYLFFPKNFDSTPYFTDYTNFTDFNFINLLGSIHPNNIEPIQLYNLVYNAKKSTDKEIRIAVEISKDLNIDSILEKDDTTMLSYAFAYSVYSTWLFGLLSAFRSLKEELGNKFYLYNVDIPRSSKEALESIVIPKKESDRYFNEIDYNLRNHYMASFLKEIIGKYQDDSILFGVFGSAHIPFITNSLSESFGKEKISLFNFAASFKYFESVFNTEKSKKKMDEGLLLFISDQFLEFTKFLNTNEENISPLEAEKVENAFKSMLRTFEENRYFLKKIREKA